MQPEFVFRNDHCRSHEPNSWLLLFDKNLPSCELFAERNLSIGTNHLDAGFGSESFHICELSLIGRSPATRSLYSAVLLHECTIARTPSSSKQPGHTGTARRSPPMKSQIVISSARTPARSGGTDYIEGNWIFRDVLGLPGMGLGGEGGIRTHDTLARIPVFETGTFNRSVTSPICARILQRERSMRGIDGLE